MSPAPAIRGREQLLIIAYKNAGTSGSNYYGISTSNPLYQQYIEAAMWAAKRIWGTPKI